LMDLSVNHQLALGNGIQTVENSDQAWARCKVDKLNKGGGAANACLDMIELKQKSGV
jgi:6,7-dimethyl-8-ribityllumazine synthase